MDKLKNCIDAPRVLARQSNDPNAQLLAERRIDFDQATNFPLTKATLALTFSCLDHSRITSLGCRDQQLWSSQRSTSVAFGGLCCKSRKLQGYEILRKI
jgi:hypothetical protein